MMAEYQFDYASIKPELYDKHRREKKAYRIVKLLENYYGKDKLKKLSVLDIGSSTGIIDYIIADKFKKVLGCDIDRKALEFAKKNLKKNNLEFKYEDAMKLTFPENTFDIVVCTQIYEHVPDSQKLFSEIYRVLKPGGVCYLAAINRLWPWEPHYNLPLLSWLPKPMANIYLRITRKSTRYYENLKTYWGLKKLTQMFKKIDYTQKILKSPDKFGYKNRILIILNPIVKLFSWFLKYLTPTFFWLLVKDSGTKDS